jgi:hypothetical protein
VEEEEDDDDDNNNNNKLSLSGGFTTGSRGEVPGKK